MKFDMILLRYMTLYAISFVPVLPVKITLVINNIIQQESQHICDLCDLRRDKNSSQEI